MTEIELMRENIKLKLELDKQKKGADSSYLIGFIVGVVVTWVYMTYV